VSETLDRSKRMILGTEDSARSDLFEIKSLVRVFVIRQVFRQNDVRHIDALCFLFTSAMTPLLTREFAIAHSKSLTLVTANTEDFQYFDDLEIADWTR